MGTGRATPVPTIVTNMASEESASSTHMSRGSRATRVALVPPPLDRGVRRWRRSPGWPAVSSAAEMAGDWTVGVGTVPCTCIDINGSAPIDVGEDCSPRHGFVKDPKQDRNNTPTLVKLHCAARSQVRARLSMSRGTGKSRLLLRERSHARLSNTAQGSQTTARAAGRRGHPHRERRPNVNGVRRSPPGPGRAAPRNQRLPPYAPLSPSRRRCPAEAPRARPGPRGDTPR